MSTTRRILFVVCAVLIAYAAVYLLLDGSYPLLRKVYLLLRPKELTFQNRNMVQWLQILKANTNSAEDPLKITQVRYETNIRIGTVESLLSYDSVKKYDFCERHGKFDIIMNGRRLTTTCWRATNGNCLLPFDTTELSSGTNQIQILFTFEPLIVDTVLQVTGAITQLIASNRIQSP